MIESTCAAAPKKQYEVANHLGNVLVTVSDKRLVQDNYHYTLVGLGSDYSYNADLDAYYYTPGAGVYAQTSGGDGVLDWYTPDVLSYSDYYAFGAPQTGRNAGDGYRYGFNGMEGDPETKGVGNSYTTDFREYDPRVGRWFSPDPVVKAWESPYAGFANNPIYYNDPSGLTPGNGDEDGGPTNPDNPYGENAVCYRELPSIKDYLAGDQVLVGGPDGQIIYTATEDCNGNLTWSPTSYLYNTVSITDSPIGHSHSMLTYRRGEMGDHIGYVDQRDWLAGLGIIYPLKMENQARAFANATGGTFSSSFDEQNGIVYTVWVDPSSTALGKAIAEEYFNRTGIHWWELSSEDYHELFYYTWYESYGEFGDRSDLFMINTVQPLPCEVIPIVVPLEGVTIAPAPLIGTAPTESVCVAPSGLLAKEKLNDYFAHKKKKQSKGSTSKGSAAANKHDKGFRHGGKRKWTNPNQRKRAEERRNANKPID